MLYELWWDTPEQWHKGNSGRAIGPARRNTPLAVIRAATTHLFYVDTANKIQEYIWSDSKWVPGATLPNTDPSDNTSLAAVCYGTGKDFEIRLYYYHQGSGVVGELWFRNGAWENGRMWFADSVEGTKMAVTNPNPSEQGGYSFHLFMVWRDLDPKATTYHINCDTCIDGNWTGPNLTPSVPADSGLACVSWPAGDGYKLRLYFTDADGDVVEYGYYSGTGWDQAPHKLSQTIKSGSKPLTALAYPSAAHTGMDIAVFVKKEQKTILEMFSNGASWLAPKELDWNAL